MFVPYLAALYLAYLEARTSDEATVTQIVRLASVANREAHNRFTRSIEKGGSIPMPWDPKEMLQ